MEGEQEDTKQDSDQPKKTDLAVGELGDLQEGFAPPLRCQQGQQPLKHKKQAERSQ